MNPIVITCGNRRSVIEGQHVSLERLRNRKKPMGVWPPTPVPDKATRLYVAQAWALKGIIDDDYAGIPK